MTTVTIHGWREGLNKVGLNHLIRQHVGSGLADAKRAVDRILDRVPVTYEFPDEKSAADFRRAVDEVGADCVPKEGGAGGVPSPSSAKA